MFIRSRFEQRIALQLVADEGLNLQVGQRQQANRLLQLRRHDQRLGLAKVEAGPDRHQRSLQREALAEIELAHFLVGDQRLG